MLITFRLHFCTSVLPVFDISQWNKHTLFVTVEKYSAQLKLFKVNLQKQFQGLEQTIRLFCFSAPGLNLDLHAVHTHRLN